MRIMLIGGGGFIGINLAISLVKVSFEVFIVDLKCQHLKHQKCLAGVMGFYERNVADSEELMALVDHLHIDCIINLVSILLPSSTFDSFESEMKTCTLPAFSLIPRVAERGVKYVFFSSGGTIYGRASSEFLTESDRCEPINFYGYSKLIFEEYLMLCRKLHGLDYLIIRPSNPYGMFQNPQRKQGFIAVAMDRLIKGEPIEIWGDGSVVRDYVYVSDLAHALALLIGKGAWNATFNIGSGIGHSLHEVLKVLESTTGRQSKIIYKDPRIVDVNRTVLSISKLKSEVDFHPRPLNEGVKAYYRKLVDNAP